jgi:hypothetical protein
VNLGTNDSGAFMQPEWRDETTGESFKLHKNPDGTYDSADIVRFEKAVMDFLSLLRRHNPSAYIVWAYGMLGYDLTLPITDAINSYRKENGDNKVFFLQLPNTTEETIGSRFHPGVKSHRQAAKLLTSYLETLLDGI